ncbi:TRAP transporter large permease subunit, partial [Kocuria sp. CPCC 205292]
AILLLTPVLLPLATAVEMDPVHLGLIMVTTLAIGLYTPPFGTTLYISASIGKVSVIETTKALWPFYLLAGLVVIIVAFFPQWVGVI